MLSEDQNSSGGGESAFLWRLSECEDSNLIALCDTFSQLLLRGYFAVASSRARALFHEDGFAEPEGFERFLLQFGVTYHYNYHIV